MILFFISGSSGGIQLIRSHLGKGEKRVVHQNANICEQRGGELITMRTCIYYIFFN